MSTGNQKKEEESLIMSLVKPLVVGSVSGCIATSVIQPIDCVKVMIQSKKEASGKNKVNLNPFHVAKELIQEDGVKGNPSHIQDSMPVWTQHSCDRWSTAAFDSGSTAF
jgi:hypothetical protein